MTGTTPLPECTCPWDTEVHDDACPYYLELRARMRLYQLRKET